MSDNKEKCLVLFSGGKDSFITAMRTIYNGYKVILISFNGGSVIGEKAFEQGANRLIRRYGENNVEYAGVYATTSTIQRLNTPWIYKSWGELGTKYPGLTNCQMQCLHCQTAMWIAAIAYCKAKGIKHIVSGYKKCDEFCTGSIEFIESITNLAQKFGVHLKLPVWEMGNNDWDRQMEMIEDSFIPQVMEPKCLIGRPPINGLRDKEHKDLIKYFKKELEPNLEKLVNNLVPVFKSIKLSNKSWSMPEYTEMDKNGTFY